MPMQHPMTMGKASPGVVSEWPPITAIPSFLAPESICRQTVRTIASVACSGSRRQEVKKAGRTPNVAISFALMLTAIHTEGRPDHDLLAPCPEMFEDQPLQKGWRDLSGRKLHPFSLRALILRMGG